MNYPLSRIPPLMRLLLKSKIEDCPDPTLKGKCWVWMGTLDNDGYGRITIFHKKYRCHRLAYTELRGPILPHLEIDHLCSNRACFNPNHLEQTTHQINCSRGKLGINNYTKTKCVNGHLFDEGNTAYHKSHGRIIRTCKICKRESSKRYYYKHKSL